jgi:hypothetical protein
MGPRPAPSNWHRAGSPLPPGPAADSDSELAGPPAGGDAAFNLKAAGRQALARRRASESTAAGRGRARGSTGTHHKTCSPAASESQSRSQSRVAR